MLLAFLFVFSIGCQSGGESSKTYPSRPLTYIVPWNPGGGTDTSARALAAVLQEYLGEPVNVVNRTGGGGVVGHLALSQARPDGYTLGAVTVEIAMMHWQGLTDLTYESYTPLGIIMVNPASVTVRADAPWNTLEELLATIRQQPGELQASGTSRGGIWDLARIGFLKAAGLPETAVPWVPSQGAAPALQELLAGGVDIVTAAVGEVDALRQAGQVKVLGVMADERLPGFPEIPTLKEQGVDWSLIGWVGIGAPKGLPEAERKVLEAAIAKTTNDPRYIEALEPAGFNLQYMPGPASGDFIAAQDSLFGELLREAGIAP